MFEKQIEILRSRVSQVYFLSKVIKFIMHIHHILFLNQIYKRLLAFYYLPNRTDKISDFQIKYLNNFLLYALNNNNYYKKKLSPCLLKNETFEFENIPLLTKEIIRNNYDGICTKGIRKTKLYPMNTGGSTGAPLKFPATIQGGYMDKAHHRFLYKLIGYQKGDIILGFCGISIPEKQRKIKKYWLPGDVNYAHYNYSSLYLNEETIPHYIANMKARRPSILRGYPSFIYDLAVYIITHQQDYEWKVKGVVLTSEMATEQQVKAIELAFSTKVWFEYGHSELSVFAFSEGINMPYYCSPYYGYTEVLDESGRHVDVGQVGEVVVTGFYTHALPFIRYKTGDRAIYGGVQKGCVTLTNLMGRTQDYIYKKNGEKIALTALIFGQHLRAFNTIEKWQLIQNTPGELEILLKVSESYNTVFEKEIIDKFYTLCNITPVLLYDKPFVITSAGKFKFLIQNVR